MYAGEPMPVTWVVSPELMIAEPKSVILMSVPPAPTSRMLAGLMSRWVTPSLCAKSSARVALNAISTILSSGRSSPGAQNGSSVPPATYSITM